MDTFYGNFRRNWVTFYFDILSHCLRHSALKTIVLRAFLLLASIPSANERFFLKAKINGEWIKAFLNSKKEMTKKAFLKRSFVGITEQLSQFELLKYGHCSFHCFCSFQKTVYSKKNCLLPQTGFEPGSLKPVLNRFNEASA